MNIIPELKLIGIGKAVIADRFPEFSRGHLTIEFKPVEDSISGVYHTYPFEDNRFRGEIEIYLDKELMIYGLRAIVGTVTHDVAHRVGWIAGYPLPSDREADDVVVARGLVYSLLAAKRALEGLRPNKVLEGYISKELLEKIRSYDLLLMALMDDAKMHHFSTDRTSVRY